MLIIKAIRIKKDGTKRWEEIGLAWKNRDGSIRLEFFYFPIDPKMDIMVVERFEDKNKQEEMVENFEQDTD